MLTALTFLIILSILIVIHEFGHFIAAKRCGVAVEKFAIGFGPPIFKIQGKETLFMICAFPLGGYVKMAGDSRSELTGSKHEFLSQPTGIKMRIVFFGPLFNYCLAFLIFSIIAMIGFPYPDNVVGKVLDGYPAQVAGVIAGDRVLAVNDKPVDNWAQMADEIYASREKAELDIERDNDRFTITIPLREKQVVDEFGRKKSASIIGISASDQVKIVKYNFFMAFVQGGKALFKLTFMVLKGFAFMVLGIVSAKDAMAGPLGIYYITSQAVKIGIVAILHLMAVLNVSLTIVNLLPLPLLDGGHLFVFMWEKITKKQVSERIEDIASKAGLVFISLLVVFVLYNDVIRFGSKLWGKKDIGTVSEISVGESK